jgi:Tfp pilus assembly protein PilF
MSIYKIEEAIAKLIGFYNWLDIFLMIVYYEDNRKGNMVKKVFFYYKRLSSVCLLFFVTGFCFGQVNFSRGEELLMQNNPAEAVVFLENAIADDPAHTLAWLYLGIVYEQLGRMEEAIATYRRVLPMAGNLSANIANNLGNVYFQRGNTEEAERFFTQAITLDSVYSRAYLGRANTRIRAGNLRNAVSDYEQYLTLEPRSSQRSSIEQLVSLIRSEFAAEERRRILAEEEARRLAEERQRLLDAVSASLQSAVDASQGISTGTESIKVYEGEFELE